MRRTIPKYVFIWLRASKLPILARKTLLERSVLRDRHSMTLVGLNSGLTIANQTAITKEGSRRLRNDSESHTTSLLDNRERNYKQSSVIVCSLLKQ